MLWKSINAQRFRCMQLLGRNALPLSCVVRACLLAVPEWWGPAGWGKHMFRLTASGPDATKRVEKHLPGLIVTYTGMRAHAWMDVTCVHATSTSGARKAEAVLRSHGCTDFKETGALMPRHDHKAARPRPAASQQ